jgi:hypothetical protein
MCRRPSQATRPPRLRGASPSVPPDCEVNHRCWPRPRQDTASRPDGPAATAGVLRTQEIPAGRARYQIPRGPRTAYHSWPSRPRQKHVRLAVR